jgi:hypothetical protein
VIHVSLPAGTPLWWVILSCIGIIILGVIYGLVRLVRVLLPDTSADRLSWWLHYWEHRRELRQDRWKRQDERQAKRHRGSSHRKVVGPMPLKQRSDASGGSKQ